MRRLQRTFWALFAIVMVGATAVQAQTFTPGPPPSGGTTITVDFNTKVQLTVYLSAAVDIVEKLRWFVAMDNQYRVCQRAAALATVVNTVFQDSRTSGSAMVTDVATTRNLAAAAAYISELYNYCSVDDELTAEEWLAVKPLITQISSLMARE